MCSSPPTDAGTDGGQSGNGCPAAHVDAGNGICRPLRLLAVVDTFDVDTSQMLLFPWNSINAAVRLTDGGISVHEPSWSNDGRSIFYARRNRSTISAVGELRSVPAATFSDSSASTRALASSGAFADFSYVQQGAEFLVATALKFSTGGTGYLEGVWSYPLDGGAALQLSSTGGNHSVHRTLGIVAFENGSEGIVLINADGTNRRVLPNTSVRDHWIEWAPSGAGVLVRRDPFTSGEPSVVMLPVDGGAPITVYAGVPQDGGSPRRIPQDEVLAWSRSGRYIAFGLSASLNGSNCTVATCGTAASTIWVVPVAPDGTPSGAPVYVGNGTRPQLAPDDRAVAFQSGPRVLSVQELDANGQPIGVRVDLQLPDALAAFDSRGAGLWEPLPQ